MKTNASRPPGKKIEDVLAIAVGLKSARMKQPRLPPEHRIVEEEGKKATLSSIWCSCCSRALTEVTAEVRESASIDKRRTMYWKLRLGIWP